MLIPFACRCRHMIDVMNISAERPAVLVSYRSLNTSERLVAERIATGHTTRQALQDLSGLVFLDLEGSVVSGSGV